LPWRRGEAPVEKGQVAARHGREERRAATPGWEEEGEGSSEPSVVGGRGNAAAQREEK